jgi:hypothetical protein
MCYKHIFPISLKIFKVEFDFKNILVGTDKLEGYFLISAIRRPRMNEFTEFYIEIPTLSKKIKGNLSNLLIRDKIPQAIEFNAGLISPAEQVLWKSKLMKGTKILIRIKAGWRNPMTIKTFLS